MHNSKRTIFLGASVLAVCCGLSCAAHEVDVEPTPLCPEGMAHLAGGRLAGEEIPAVCMDITEVTTAAYGVCVEDGGCPPVVVKPEAAKPQQCNYVIAGHEQHPINCIDESQAAAYCNWAGKRVPRESEWLWAAQGRSRATTYPWGHAPVDAIRVCWQRDKIGTCMVGARPAGASPEGVLDLFGNVAEWTASNGVWQARGGSWSDTPASASWLAVATKPQADRKTLDDTGVRCVVDLHTPVRTIDSQSWAPSEQAQVAPIVRVYPDVAPRPAMPAPGRPLANLAPLWHEYLGQASTSNVEWPLAGKYRKVDPAVAKKFGLTDSIDTGKWPAALAGFDPFLSAGPLVLMSKGRQYSS
ncbi:MAG: formylglycine-generating enzyme family protein, partial [Nannocystaceae bacterium]